MYPLLSQKEGDAFPVGPVVWDTRERECIMSLGSQQTLVSRELLTVKQISNIQNSTIFGVWHALKQWMIRCGLKGPMNDSTTKTQKFQLFLRHINNQTDNCCLVFNSTKI